MYYFVFLSGAGSDVVRIAVERNRILPLEVQFSPFYQILCGLDPNPDL